VEEPIQIAVAVVEMGDALAAFTVTMLIDEHPVPNA
jgi:hypothetical protein